VTDNGRNGKGRPITGHKGPEREQKYSSTLSLTSALDGAGGQRHAPAALPPGKTRYPLYRRLGGSQSRTGQVRKISSPQGFDSRTAQPLAKLIEWSVRKSLPDYDDDGVDDALRLHISPSVFIYEIINSRSLARCKVSRVISAFRRGLNEIYALLGSHAAYEIANLRCARSQKSADLKVKFYLFLAEHHLIKT
jgi:hypothetical protein